MLNVKNGKIPIRKKNEIQVEKKKAGPVGVYAHTEQERSSKLALLAERFCRITGARTVYASNAQK